MTAVIVFKNTEDGNLRSVLFKVDETLLHMRQRWSQITGLDFKNYAMRVGDEVIPKDGLISDLPMLGGTCVKISVEKITTHHIVIIGCPDIQLSLEICPSWYVNDVALAVSEKLSITPRNMRVIMENQELSSDETLCEQGFNPSEILSVDIPIEIEITVHDCEEARCFACFGSDSVNILYDEDLPVSSQRFYFEGKRIPEDTENLAMALNISGDIGRQKWDVDCELCFTIYVIRNKNECPEFSELQVFPHQLIHDICERDYDEVSYLGSIVSRTQTFFDLDVPVNALFYVGKFFKLNVLNSIGSKSTICIENKQTVADLRCLVYNLECTPDFLIKFRKTVLYPESFKLSSFRIMNSSRLQLSCKGKLVLLIHEDKECNLGWTMDSISFEELSLRAQEHFQVPIPPDTLFECSCGRNLFRNNEYGNYQGLCSCNPSSLKIKIHRPVDLYIRVSNQDILPLRLPTTTTVNDVLNKVRTSSSFDGSAYLNIHDKRLIGNRPLFQIKITEKIYLNLVRKIEFTIENEDNVHQWSAWPDDFLCDILEKLKTLTIAAEAVDFAVLGNRRMDVYKEINGSRRTLMDYGVKPGCILKVINAKDYNHLE